MTISYWFSARRFPRRVISHPYCYVHYDVLDTTCVIGCLMNDILILFLCLLSRMLFGVFLISFSLVLGDFPREWSAIPIVMCTTMSLIPLALLGVWWMIFWFFFYVYYPECYSGLSYIFRFSTRRFPREFPYLYKKKQTPQVHKP